MPHLAPLCVLLSACATTATGRVSAPPPAPEAPPLVPAPPSALEVVKVACPHEEKQHPLPACHFQPSTVRAAGALVKASENTCRLVLAPRFAAPDALALTVDVSEGARAFSVAFIERLDGARFPGSDRLRDPVLTASGVAGLEWRDGRTALWLDGVCEAPREGSFESLAVLSDGALLALWRRADSNAELVERGVDGAWRSLGPVPLGPQLRLINDAGRAALVYAEESNWARRDFGLYSTDTGRSMVFGRLTEPATVASWGLGGLWLLRAPRAGARLSDAVNLKSPPYTETPTLFSADPVTGGARVVLPKLAFVASRCRQPKGPKEKVTGRWSSASALIGTEVEGTLLLARVEQRGDCVAEYEPPEPFHCPPGAPCAPPPGPRLRVTNTTGSNTLVLFTVTGGEAVREVARVELPPADLTRTVGGLDLSVTESRVWVAVANQLLEFDRARLLGGAR